MLSSDPQGIAVPVVWLGADEAPVKFANAFLAVVQPNEIFLTIGSYTPPPIVGATVEERAEMARKVAVVPIKPIARVGMTPARLNELIGVLQEALRNYEQMMTALEQRRTET